MPNNGDECYLNFIDQSKFDAPRDKKMKIHHAVSFMFIDFQFHFSYHGVPHIIYQMEAIAFTDVSGEAQVQDSQEVIGEK